MKEVITHSYEETLSMASDYAKTLPKGSVIGFVGGLGMGKTAFTTGFVKGLGINADVSSPTFAICNDYIGENARVYHLICTGLKAGTTFIPQAFSIISKQMLTFLPNGAKMFSVLCPMTPLLLK